MAMMSVCREIVYMDEDTRVRASVGDDGVVVDMRDIVYGCMANRGRWLYNPKGVVDGNPSGIL